MFELNVTGIGLELYRGATFINDFLVNTFSDKPVKNLYRVFSPTWAGCRVHKSNAPTILLQRRGGVKLV